MRKVTQNTSKGFQIFSIFISILLVAATGVTIFELLNLSVLPENLLIPVLLIILLIVLISLILIHAYAKKKAMKIFTSLFVIVLTGVLSFGSYYMYTTASMLSNITTHEGEVKNTVSLIVLEDSEIESLDDVKDGKIGYLRTIDNYGTEQFFKAADDEFNGKKDNSKTGMVLDVEAQEEPLEGTEATQEETSEEKEPVFAANYSDVPVEQRDYNSIQVLLDALYDGEVDAIVLNEVYRTNAEELEKYMDFSKDTKVVYEAVYYTEKSNNALEVSDITSDSFNILISGNDTYGDVGELSRSDVNMVVTINPSTGTILLTSIPRDMYVEASCDVADGCQVGAMDKITHMGIHGVNASKMTVENLLGIEINYTFRVNFSSVTEIVDALGGIDVYVEEGLAVDTFYADSSLQGVTEGWNHLDGARALSFARERYAYADGDNQRVKNQQIVMEAIVNKAISPDIIVNYASLMKAFSGAFETNMSTSDITSLIKYQLSTNMDWKFESYQIAGVGDMLFCAEAGQSLSVQVPDMRTVQIAREKIEAVKNGDSSEEVDVSWLDTTYPVYNYYGGYDHTIDYSTGSYSSQSAPVDQTYTDNSTYYDPSYDTSYDQSYDTSYDQNYDQSYDQGYGTGEDVTYDPNQGTGDTSGSGVVPETPVTQY